MGFNLAFKGLTIVNLESEASCTFARLTRWWTRLLNAYEESVFTKEQTMA